MNNFCRYCNNRCGPHGFCNSDCYDNFQKEIQEIKDAPMTHQELLEKYADYVQDVVNRNTKDNPVLPLSFDQWKPQDNQNEKPKVLGDAGVGDNPFTTQHAAKLAVSILKPFAESNLYEDYKKPDGNMSDDGYVQPEWSDEQYDLMVESLDLLAMNGPYRQAIFDAAEDIQKQSEEGADREKVIAAFLNDVESNIREILPDQA